MGLFGMNNKVKYLSVLVLALLVSVATSYVTTSAYLTNQHAESLNVGTVDVNNLPPQVMQQISDDIVLQLTKTNVSLSFEVSYFAGGNSLVEVNGRVALENLTIVYQYTRLSDGTSVVESVDYGTFIPAWGAGAVIEEGASPKDSIRFLKEFCNNVQSLKATITVAWCLKVRHSLKSSEYSATPKN